jgi:cell division septation protein DedD
VNSRYLEEDDDLDSASGDREISLSPSTLLGIFFLLAIICAIFFGFGYSMGHRSALASTQSAENSETAPLKASGDTKPAPGLANSAADLTTADAAAQTMDDSAPSEDTAPAPVNTPAPAAKPRLERASAPQAAPQLKPAVAVKTPPATVATTAPAPAARVAPAGAPALVQVAAVSHQEDADILATALKRKGYTVAIRHEPQDKLLHIQLGPFASRKEADVMKQRLSADGYNAIVK